MSVSSQEATTGEEGELELLTLAYFLLGMTHSNGAMKKNSTMLNGAG